MNALTRLQISYFFKAADFTSSEDGEHPNVESMLKGLGKTPVARHGDPDSLTEKIATMDKEASVLPKTIAALQKVLRPAADPFLAGAVHGPTTLVRGIKAIGRFAQEPGVFDPEDRATHLRASQDFLKNVAPSWGRESKPFKAGLVSGTVGSAVSPLVALLKILNHKHGESQKTAYVKDPQGFGDNLGNLTEMAKLVHMAKGNPDKMAPAEDVLQDKSMTVPFGVVRGAAGAAGGAMMGNLVSRLFTGPIDPGASERTAREVRKKRNVGAGIGGALGLYLASKKDLLNPELFNSVRQRFAV